MHFNRALRAVACRHDGSRVFPLAIVTLLLATVGFSVAGAEKTTAKAPSHFFVSDTGHGLGEPYLSYWVKIDGKTTLGLPVSEPATWNGQFGQYFELGYLQLVARSGNSYKPVLPPAGLDLLDARHDPGRLVAGRRVGGSRADEAFLASSDGTSPRLKGRTETYYERHGGASRFGKPISKEYVANGMRLQWFEYGRLQWLLADKKVTVAPVGLELAHARGIDTTRIEAGSLPKFDPKRFRTFSGDGTVPEAPGAFSPVRIQIPKISINAVIEKVAIKNGIMEVPGDAWSVGWYAGLAKPGERTNVVMAGHKDWWGIGPVVFWNLNQLRPGDKIYLVAKNGQGSTYVVKESWDVDANVDAREIIGDLGFETLTLITCGGAFDGSEYLSRHIVRAERI